MVPACVCGEKVVVGFFIYPSMYERNNLGTLGADLEIWSGSVNLEWISEFGVDQKKLEWIGVDGFGVEDMQVGVLV